MHRTYSMRQSRAPTASQIQNPPPPSSSTKAGRFFGKSNIEAFTAGEDGEERHALHGARWQRENGGRTCDDDVSDVTDKLGVLIYEIGELEDQFVDKYDQYRVTIKSIRNIEASVQPSRDRKQKITDQIAQLKYKEPNSPKIVVLEQELVRAEAESLVAEAQLSNITREKLKAAFTYQFDALREHSEKMAIIAGYGKHLLELIDDTPVTPGETRNAYDGYEASKASSLSTRTRTLSQRRRNRHQGEAVDLAGQDAPMEQSRDSNLWIPASQHHNADRYEDDDEEEDASVVNDSVRGREEERVAA
ncbi:unnamed protein product [Aureobasidium vineae]|uniref:Uncharacterized protein n=1 Tax=Aureobasidium vineae TaxID=2773715 RepID=A0A9N8P678_9PEZI|nr:unnamed protein product [Aureobasidium vineae]